MVFAIPQIFSQVIHFPPRLAYAIGLGPVIGRLVMLLATTGRKSGKQRITPLQYEEQDEKIYLGSALGVQADWVRNIMANPVVNVQVGSRRFSGLAEVVTDPARMRTSWNYACIITPDDIRHAAWEASVAATRQDLEKYLVHWHW
jgi:deazaflavin-dependent oxidoreductase (nitroreductase family)